MKSRILLAKAASVTLSQAILVYHDEGNRALATIHAVELGKDDIRPQIGPGRCLGPEDLSSLLEKLTARSASRSILVPPTLLAYGLDRVTWYRPPAPAQLWFAPQAEQSPLLPISGETFPQPGLIFHAERGGLCVFAYLGRERPTRATRLHRAPYWNLNAEGVLCIGSARIPRKIDPTAIERVERAFFASKFTHSNLHGKPIVEFPGGHDAFWPAMKGRSRFPEKVLIPLQETLADLLK